MFDKGSFFHKIINHYLAYNSYVLYKYRNMILEDVGSVVFFYDSLKTDDRESQPEMDRNELYLFI